MDTPLSEEQLANIANNEEKRALSIADRLRRRVRMGIIPIKFEDDLGDFEVLIKMPTPSQRKMLAKFFIDVSEAQAKGTTEGLDELDNQVAQLIADLCVDKSLDLEFWTSEKDYGVDIIPKIMRVILGIDQKELADYRFFRDDATR